MKLTEVKTAGFVDFKEVPLNSHFICNGRIYIKHDSDSALNIKTNRPCGFIGAVEVQEVKITEIKYIVLS